MSFYSDPEGSYRRGYTHGAWDVIEAVRGLLPAREQAKLEAWFSGPAQEWRMENLRGESKRDENGDFTATLYPPRRFLHLGKSH
jgi:hypothetical protein